MEAASATLCDAIMDFLISFVRIPLPRYIGASHGHIWRGRRRGISLGSRGVQRVLHIVL